MSPMPMPHMRRMPTLPTAVRERTHLDKHISDMSALINSPTSSDTPHGFSFTLSDLGDVMLSSDDQDDDFAGRESGYWVGQDTIQSPLSTASSSSNISPRSSTVHRSVKTTSIDADTPISQHSVRISMSSSITSSSRGSTGIPYEQAIQTSRYSTNSASSYSSRDSASQDIIYTPRSVKTGSQYAPTPSIESFPLSQLINPSSSSSISETCLAPSKSLRRRTTASRAPQLSKVSEGSSIKTHSMIELDPHEQESQAPRTPFSPVSCYSQSSEQVHRAKARQSCETDRPKISIVTPTCNIEPNQEPNSRLTTYAGEIWRDSGRPAEELDQRVALFLERYPQAASDLHDVLAVPAASKKDANRRVSLVLSEHGFLLSQLEPQSQAPPRTRLHTRTHISDRSSFTSRPEAPCNPQAHDNEYGGIAEITIEAIVSAVASPFGETTLLGQEWKQKDLPSLPLESPTLVDSDSDGESNKTYESNDGARTTLFGEHDCIVVSRPPPTRPARRVPSLSFDEWLDRPHTIKCGRDISESSKSQFNASKTSLSLPLSVSVPGMSSPLRTSDTLNNASQHSFAGLPSPTKSTSSFSGGKLRGDKLRSPLPTSTDTAHLSSLDSANPDFELKSHSKSKAPPFPVLNPDVKQKAHDQNQGRGRGRERGRSRNNNNDNKPPATTSTRPLTRSRRSSSLDRVAEAVKSFGAAVSTAAKTLRPFKTVAAPAPPGGRGNWQGTNRNTNLEDVFYKPGLYKPTATPASIGATPRPTHRRTSMAPEPGPTTGFPPRGRTTSSHLPHILPKRRKTSTTPHEPIIAPEYTGSTPELVRRPSVDISQWLLETSMHTMVVIPIRRPGHGRTPAITDLNSPNSAFSPSNVTNITFPSPT